VEVVEVAVGVLVVAALLAGFAWCVAVPVIFGREAWDTWRQRRRR
jgi:hypothetical protein